MQDPCHTAMDRCLRLRYAVIRQERPRQGSVHSIHFALSFARLLRYIYCVPAWLCGEGQSTASVRDQSSSQYRRWIMTASLLISADSHIVEPPDLYSSRIEPKFLDRAPRM